MKGAAISPPFSFVIPEPIGNPALTNRPRRNYLVYLFIRFLYFFLNLITLAES